MHLPSDLQATIPAAVLPCPGAGAYGQMLLQRNGSVNEPFFIPAPMVGVDIDETIQTIKKAQDADADGDVWFIYAHDTSLLGTVDLFPLPANDWKKKDWRRKTLWAFLRDFDEAIKLQK